MAREGFKSISVSVKVHARLRKLADKQHRTVPKTIEHLLDGKEA